MAEWLKAWILYVLKILTLILKINLGIVLFPFKLASSVAKFLKKDIAKPLIARIVYWYKMLKVTYFFFHFAFSLWVGHMHHGLYENCPCNLHAVDHYRAKLGIALLSAGIDK